MSEKLYKKLGYVGGRPTPGRPYLKLCKPCNARDATMPNEEKDELGGTPLCVPCAALFDQWVLDCAAWRRRQARNKRKALRRKQRRARRVLTARR